MDHQITPIKARTRKPECGWRTIATHSRTSSIIFLFSCLLLTTPSPAAGQTHTTWCDYAGGEDSAQYSALEQINRSNVSKLEVAWTFPTGDDNRYFFNPIEVDGLTYVLAENNSIVALDAATGKKVWVHQSDPQTTIITDRGINYWESKDRRDRRLLFASNHALQSIDARTGKSRVAHTWTHYAMYAN